MATTTSNGLRSSCFSFSNGNEPLSPSSAGHHCQYHHRVALQYVQLNCAKRKELQRVLFIGSPVVDSWRGREDGRYANRRALFAFFPNSAAVAAPLACASRPAHAVTAEEVAFFLSKVQNLYLQLADLMKAAFEVARTFVIQIISLVEALILSSTPMLGKIASMALEASAYVVKLAQKLLQAAGIDTKPVAEAFRIVALTVDEASKQILSALKPLASSALHWMLATDTLVLFKSIGVLMLVYFFVPPVYSTVASAARGYKGDFSALEALDMVMKKDYLLIDIRTEKEKHKSGVPNIPRTATHKLLCVPVEGLSHKFKGQLRDYRRAEAEVAAIKISFLKKINKSSKLVILDRFGDIAKMVARSLTRLGIKNTWVVMDGFDGGKGWVQSRLGTASHSTSIAELFLPSRIISEGAKRIFPSPKVIDVSPEPRKLLPGGNDE